ncbi:ATP-binding protein [Paenibacillus sp. SI8]|uniref:ATP-binding protein n=1 Tax=unclassified Paenibacillus TaxID=185978 RepID=UPI003466EC87
MLFVLFALWIIALLLLLIDPRSSTMRWLSAVAFTGGIGALAAVLSESVIPNLRITIPNPSIIALLYRIQAGSSLLSYYGLPYSFAMLALQYNPYWLKREVRRLLPYLLLLPPVACLLFTPGYTEVMPISYPIVSCWVIPYILCGSALIAFKKERLPAMQRTHLFNCLALLPPILCFAVLNYVMPSFGFYRMWVYHTWTLAFVVPTLAFTFFKYGLLGVRLFVERRELNSTLRAITSGTAIMNHAIKNDVGKMRLFLEKMKQHAEETNQKELLQDLDVVLGASIHIRDMISRVHEQTQEIPLRIGPVLLNDLIDNVLASLAPNFTNIKLTKAVPEEMMLQLDRMQTAETLTNVLMNAIDAMPRGGELAIKVFVTKKKIVIEVRDTGIGMDKSVLKQILEPFYTTKSGSRNNFGLGLPYCYNVMKKHGGSLELTSSPGKGTSVFLIFPGTRLLT